MTAASSGLFGLSLLIKRSRMSMVTGSRGGFLEDSGVRIFALLSVASSYALFMIQGCLCTICQALTPAM